MPAATLEQRHQNLARLLSTTSPHCPPEPSLEKTAHSRAQITPLTHAVQLGKLPGILTSEALLSQAAIGKRVGDAERILDTTDDVFLYVGAFEYPATECGFLFLHSLEAAHQKDGIATPFDSGALATMKYVTPPASYADGISCVREHELPVFEYRELLTRVMLAYSPSPDDFLTRPKHFSCACGASRPHPFGLSGGDNRAATFEVRIPNRVPLEPPHLRAVFVPDGLEFPELDMLSALGVKIKRYQARNDGNDFYILRETCIEFILTEVFV